MIRSLALLLAGVLVSAAPVLAHSLLLESDPRVDATVTQPPPRLLLRFNNRIERRLCRVDLLDARGARRALALHPDDAAVDRLTAELPPLAPGAYRIEWRVLSADGHVVSGFFKFHVGP